MKNLFFVIPLLCAIATAVPVAAIAQTPPAQETQEFSDDEFADEEFDDDFDDEFDDEFDDVEEIAVSDPFESFNRGMFWFNDKFYFYLLKPVAKVYRNVPEPARVSVSNFFSNLTTPIRFVNALMQGKIHDACNEFGRFMINTTFGIGGLFDPARKYAGIRRKEEDFGQTLGTYGIGPGYYLVIPIVGPLNVRDGIGFLVDTYADPTALVWQGQAYWVARGADLVNTVSLDRDTYEAIKRDALDPYLFVRDAYMQNRAGKVKD